MRRFLNPKNYASIWKTRTKPHLWKMTEYFRHNRRLTVITLGNASVTVEFRESWGDELHPERQVVRRKHLSPHD